VLEHTLHPAKVIEEIARVSKPGGVVILSMPDEDLINRIKGVLVATGIVKLLYQNIPNENEWHLHDFSLPILGPCPRVSWKKWKYGPCAIGFSHSGMSENIWS